MAFLIKAVSSWIHFKSPALLRFNYWACTAIGLFFFTFILTPLNTLGNVSAAFLLLGLFNILVQPSILKELLSKPIVWWVVAIILFAFFDFILIEGVRDEMSGRQFRNAMGYMLGLGALAVFLVSGWNRQLMLPAIMLGTWLGGYFSFQNLLLSAGRIDPASYNTIYLGILSGLLLVLLVVFGIEKFRSRQWAWVILIVLSIVVAFVNLMVSGSRGPLLAVLITIPLVVWYASQNKLRAALVGLLLFSLMVSLVVALVYVMPHQGFSQRVILAVEEVSDYAKGNIVRSSSGARLQMWHISIEAFKASPVIGLDRTQIDELKDKMIAQGLADPYVKNFGHMHNDMLHFLATRGALGLFLFVFLLAVLLKATWRQQSIEAALLFGFLMLFVTSGFTNALMASGRGAMLLFIMATLLLTAIHHAQREQNQASD